MEKQSNDKLIPVFQMENQPAEGLYKLMVRILETQEKDDYIYTFAKVYPQSYENNAIDFNKSEIERLQLIFDKKRFDNNLKEQLRQERVLIVFGKLNKEIGGRSFSVYKLALMPESVIEIKDPNKGNLKVKVE